jgi:hypothetical protein
MKTDRIDAMLDKVNEGLDPQEVVEEMLEQMDINPKYGFGNPVPNDNDGVPSMNDDQIRLVNPGDAGKAKALWDAKQLPYDEIQPGWFAFNTDGEQTLALQALQLQHIPVKSFN